MARRWLLSRTNFKHEVLIPVSSEIGFPDQYVFSAENGDILLGDMSKPDAAARILLPKDGVLDVRFAS